MSETEPGELRPGPKRTRWVAVTVVALTTIVVLALSIEAAARLLYTESSTSTLECLILTDPTTGVRAKPNSVCLQKGFETRLTKYAFNSCGHRAGVECGEPKAADTRRIVLVGSSFAYGMWVEQDHSFAALLPAELGRRTGLKIELYNEAMQWGTPHSVDLRFGEVLAAKPDIVLWALTPFDLDNVDLVIPWVPHQDADATAHAAGGAAPPSPGLVRRIAAALTKKSPVQFVEDAWSKLIAALDETRTVFWLQHLLFKSQSQYVKSFLMRGESADFLRTRNDPQLERSLAHFEAYLADVQARAASVGAKVVVVMLPQRAQAAMISRNQWPAGFDPYRIGEETRAVVLRQHATYVDALHGFRAFPHAERAYLPVDGHINDEGHAIAARVLADALAPEVAAPVAAPH